MDPTSPDTYSRGQHGSYGRAAAPDFGYQPPPSSSPSSPSSLQLEQVHYMVRHGERTPVRSRLQNADPPIPARWKMCKEGNKFRAAVLKSTGRGNAAGVTTTTRAVELADDKGKTLEVQEGDCLYGELTDIGRQSTFEVGQRIRRLYIDRLGLLPEPSKMTAKDADMCYFRSTNMSRTVESLQQIVAGLFSDPSAASHAGNSTAAPIIFQGPSSSASTSALSDAFSPRLLVRDGSIEDLLPNTYVCAAFRALDQHFASAAAQTWNPHLAKYDAQIMPHTDDGRTAIRVDSHPRLNGILDTINASLAHGIAVPRPFVEDKQLLRDMERAVVTEWFSGYFAKDEKIRSKYRRLGMGRFLNSVADSMEARATPSLSHLPGNKLRLGVYAAHDTSLSGILCTLDAFEDRWPAFTASLGFELFRDTAPSVQPGVFSRIGSTLGLTAPARSPHYIRTRFGDETIRVPACAAKGKHLITTSANGVQESHPEFCTLEAFLELTRALKNPDGLTWAQECSLDRKAISSK